MNAKMLLASVAVCLLLVSGTDGYRRRHVAYERKVFRELGDAAADGVNELADSLEEDFDEFKEWFSKLRRIR